MDFLCILQIGVYCPGSSPLCITVQQTVEILVYMEFLFTVSTSYSVHEVI